jgi:opacity protein-like surface antigen
MITNRSLFGIACRAAAFSFLMAGSASLIEAQQSSPIVSAPKAPLFLASESTPLDLTGTSSSSSSSSGDATPAYAKLDLNSAALGNSQPPPRRTYGRPAYHGGNTNPDGSNKYFGLVGFGLGLPVGITHKYETESWGFGGGVGRNFSKTLGVDAEFNYDHFGLQGATLNNESYLYGATGQGFDGNNHVWSFSLNPTFTLPTEGSLGAYAVVGVGFYHKVTNFTTPQTECLDPYCIYVGTVNATCGAICHYSSNAPGFSGGIGLTYKFSKFSNERFYVEARYVFVDNSYRSGLTVADSTSPPYGTPGNPGGTYTGYNAYPANSNRTTYIPIKVGIRF